MQQDCCTVPCNKFFLCDVHSNLRIENVRGNFRNHSMQVSSKVRIHFVTVFQTLNCILFLTHLFNVDKKSINKLNENGGTLVVVECTYHV